VTDSMYRYGERSQRLGGGGGEILVAAGEDIPALATSTSAFGAHAPFLSVDSRGCLLPSGGSQMKDWLLVPRLRVRANCLFRNVRKRFCISLGSSPD
jgi:hypothetical protein